MMTEGELKPIIEALIYVAEEPITESTLVTLLGKEHKDSIGRVIVSLVEQYQSADHGMEIKEIANGYKMATKAEHHEWVGKYVKHQTPPIKLSLAALETLAVIAYKQPITIPEIQEIRGVNAAGVLKTLIDKKLVTTAGRKNVIGRPILYKTTQEFLVHFGLKNLGELPSLKEFEQLIQPTSGISAGGIAELAPAAITASDVSSESTSAEMAANLEFATSAPEPVTAGVPSAEIASEESQVKESKTQIAQSK